MAKHNAKKPYSDADPLDDKNIFVSDRINTGYSQPAGAVGRAMAENNQNSFQNPTLRRGIFRAEILKYVGTVNTGGMTARWLSSYSAELSDPPERLHAYKVRCENTPDSLILPPSKPIPSTKTGGEVITKANSKDHKQCDLFDECIQVDGSFPQFRQGALVEITYEHTGNWHGCVIKRQIFQSTELKYDDLKEDPSAKDSINAVQTNLPQAYYEIKINTSMMKTERNAPLEDKYLSPITGKPMSEAERTRLINARDAYLRGDAPTPFD